MIKVRSFIAVAEQLSFRRASETLHLSQSALSTHVRDLEAMLGVPLLSRTTRSIRLTREGNHFLIGAKRALSELQSVVLDLKEEASLARGRVSVACVPTIASSILPTILAVFGQRFPRIRVRVLDEISEAVNQRVLSREADLGIGPTPPRNIDLEFEPLLRDHFIAVFPNSHELAGRKNLRLKDLAKYPLVALKPRTNVRDILDEAFLREGLGFDPVYEPVHHYTLGSMVEAGLGVTALPSMSLSLLGHPRLASAPIADTAIFREIGILKRRDSVLPPAAAEFLKTTKAVFAASAPKSAAAERSRARKDRGES